MLIFIVASKRIFFCFVLGMKLQAINLPSRLTTTDVGMKSLVGKSFVEY